MKRKLNFLKVEDYLNMWFRYEPTPKPHPDKNIFIEERYCENPECSVREVWIFHKYPKKNENKFCPNCKRTLKFHNYLREEIKIIK